MHAYNTKVKLCKVYYRIPSVVLYETVIELLAVA